MLYTYGKAPFDVVVVHGGPGAMGTMSPLAKDLGRSAGVLEPLQSRYSVDELVEELQEQVSGNCEGPVVMIGHSWGAWLSMLYAARYPSMVRDVVMVGSPPLDLKHAGRIMEKRRERLKPREWQVLNNRLGKLDRAKGAELKGMMNEVSALLSKTEHFEPLKTDAVLMDRVKPDGEMYRRVWSEAEDLLKKGELIRRFKNIRSRLFMIHGDADPRPVEAVTIPLGAHNIRLAQRYILSKCGHFPFLEKHASKRFFGIVRSIIAGKPLLAARQRF